MKRTLFIQACSFYGKQKSFSCSALRSCRAVFTLPRKLRMREWEGMYAFWLHPLCCRIGRDGLYVYEQNWSHGIKFFTNFSSVCSSHMLQLFSNCCYHGSFPTGCSPSGIDCSQHSHRQKLLPENLLLHGLPSKGCICCQELQCELSTDCSFFQAVSICCRVGSFPCRGGIACFTTVCRGTSPPVSAALPLLLFHSSWCLQSCFPYAFLFSQPVQQLVHFLKYHGSTTGVTDGLSFGQWWVYFVVS